MKRKMIWAYLYMPILFVIVGYGTLYLVLAPFLNFVTSSVDLILLNEAPTFDTKNKSLFDGATVAQSTTDAPQSIPSSTIDYPSIGDEYGQLLIDKVKIKSPLTFGDRPEDLRTGVGHFNGSVFPGEQGTSLIGGHNTTDLGAMDLVDIGDMVTIQTHYGTYLYTITQKKVARFDDPTAITSLSTRGEGHHLILYTCYPVDMIGLTDDRLFVYADLTSGPLIDSTE